MEGRVLPAYHRVADAIGHVQLADTPGRHEPGSGSSDLHALLVALLQDGYGGSVALEYVPMVSVERSLGWLPRRLRSGPVGDLAGLALPEPTGKVLDGEPRAGEDGNRRLFG
jgi:hypothetical protein